MNWRKVKRRLKALNQAGFPIAYREQNGAIYLIRNGKVTCGFAKHTCLRKSSEMAQLCWDQIKDFPRVRTPAEVFVTQSLIVNRKKFLVELLKKQLIG
jgi:hypothetical protein